MSKAIGRRNWVLDDWNHRLFTNMPVGDAEKPGFLFFDWKYKIHSDELNRMVYRDLYIGINLRMSDYKKSKYNFQIDPNAFYGFITALRECADSEKPCLFEIPYKNYIFPGGQRSEKRVEQAKLVVGRDTDGVFIGLNSRETEPAKFYITPNGIYPCRWVNGEVETVYATSRTYANAYADLWKDQVKYILTHCYMDDDEYERAKAEAKAESGRRFKERQQGKTDYKPKPKADNPWNGGGQSDAPLDTDIPW